MSSPRKYLYGVTQEDDREFIHTFLSSQDAMKYAKDHAKLFKGRFCEYMIGSMSEEMDKWIVYKPLEG